MQQSHDLHVSVRRELSLEALTRRRRRSPLLGLCAATALLWGLGGSPLLAQAPYQQELIPGFSTLKVRGASNPGLVDLDGDGDLDAVVGDSAGSLSYFENTGSSSVPAFVGPTGSANPFDGIDVGNSSSPDLVDLDGDGDLDAVVGNRTGSLVYFENTGSSSAPVFVEQSGSANPFAGIDVGLDSSPDLVDLDGDGDLDAIVGELYGSLRSFENTGGSSTPAFVERTGSANPFDGIDIGNSSSSDLVDLDGDGDLDAIVGELHGSLRSFENTGSSSIPAFVEQTGGANPFDGINVGNSSSPELVDLDGDGDLDAVAGDSAGNLSYFENTGSSSAPVFVEPTGSASPFAGIDVGYWSSPDLVDLDGDGDLDAIVGEHQGSLQYFKNTGSSSAPVFVEQSGSANPFAGIDVGSYSNPNLVDLDGDGDLDVAAGEFSESLRYVENTGSSSAPAFVERTGSANPLSGIEVGFESSPELVDPDGDGDLDAIVGEFYGTLRYFENTGSSSAPHFVERTGSASPFAGIDVGFESSPELVDLDGDGDLDAVVGERLDILLTFENTGSPSVPAFVERSGSASPFAGIRVSYSIEPNLVDLDGDRDLDLLVGEGGGKVVFFRSLHIIFADGFESGDALAWSASVPDP